MYIFRGKRGVYGSGKRGVSGRNADIMVKAANKDGKRNMNNNSGSTGEYHGEEADADNWREICKNCSNSDSNTIFYDTGVAGQKENLISNVRHRLIT